MKHKILAVCMAFVLSFVSVLPAHAASGVIETYVASNFADWLCRGAQSTFNKFWASATGQDFICPENHNTVDGAGYHNFVDRYTLGPDGKFGHYYVCEYCETLLSDVFPEAYDSYSSSLPASGYDSTGRYIVYLGDCISFDSDAYLVEGSTRYYFDLSYEYNGNLWHTVLHPIDFPKPSVDIGNRVYCPATFTYPISGTYQAQGNKGNITSHYFLYDSSKQPSYQSYDYKSSYNAFPYVNFNGYHVQGSSVAISDVYVAAITCPTGKRFYSSSDVNSEFVVQNLLVYPDEDISSQYTTDSRPSSFNNSGALGVQTGDDNLTVLDHSNIVDETNNTYYNPVTQTDNSIKSWTYDYSTRTYNVTLDNGQTVTVTYGDENITINEGDTVYNVYYVYQGTGPDPTPTPGPGGDTHQHNYTSEDTKAPTCTMPGTRKFTCEECGDTYTKAIPATGHDWQVKTEVKTEYGEDGELLQEGYTIYQCSVCGEEYKSTAQTGPPPSGGGGSDDDDSGDGSGIGDALGKLFGVIGDLLTGLLGGAVELFTSLIGGIGEIFQQIITFSSGFIDLLSALFPFIPKEIMTAISAGIIIMIVLAILKFIRG